MDRKQYDEMVEQIGKGNSVVFNGRRALTLDRLNEIIAQGGDSVPGPVASEPPADEGAAKTSADDSKPGKTDK